MNSRRVLLAQLLLLSGVLSAQDLNHPDGFRVVKVEGARGLGPIGDVNADGIDDLGKVSPRDSSTTGKCLLVVPGALSHPATITPATSGGQFCSEGSSSQELGRVLFGTNFCGVGTRSVAFGYNNYHNGFIYTMPRSGVVGWQTILVCNGTNEKVISKLGDLNGDGTDDLWFGTSGGGPGWLRFGKRPENPVNFCDHSAPAPSNITCDGQVIRRPSGGISESAYRLGNLGGDSGIDLGFTGSGTLFGLFSFASDDLNAITSGQGFKMTLSSGSISSVAGDIDLNADGMLDVVIGFEGADSAGLSSNGRVYIVYGRAGGFPFETDLDSPQQDVVRLDGSSNLEFLGRHMAALDFDGDGIDDVVVPGANGAIYVLFGHPSQLSSGPITATSYQSARIAAPTGQIASLSSDFDFNDDGIEDFGINGPGGQDVYYVVLGRSNGLFNDSFE